MGKGTYGTTKGRPPKKKSMLTAKQKTLPASLQKKIMDFEEDVFNLLPIDNIEGLKESIKLINFTLGIVKKKELDIYQN